MVTAICVVKPFSNFAEHTLPEAAMQYKTPNKPFAEAFLHSATLRTQTITRGMD
jgi:hypothetical protein